MPHTLHCLVHSCKLTSRTWQDCARLLSSITSWTGDLGTEAKVAGVHTRITDLFGDWVQQSDADVHPQAQAAAAVPAAAAPPAPPAAEPGPAQAGEDFDFNFQGEENYADSHGGEQHDEEVEREEPYLVNMRGSCFIPGVLHIIHNMTEDLKASLFGWQPFVVKLRNVTRLLRRPQRRLACTLTSPALTLALESRARSRAARMARRRS